MAAIAYKKAITQFELAEWSEVERKTIYNWLTRLESADLDEAIKDEKRPGRTRKLDEEDLEKLEEILHDPPKDREEFENEPKTPLRLGVKLIGIDHMRTPIHVAPVQASFPRRSPSGMDFI